MPQKRIGCGFDWRLPGWAAGRLRRQARQLAAHRGEGGVACLLEVLREGDPIGTDALLAEVIDEVPHLGVEVDSRVCSRSTVGSDIAQLQPQRSQIDGTHLRALWATAAEEGVSCGPTDLHTQTYMHCVNQADIATRAGLRGSRSQENDCRPARTASAVSRRSAAWPDGSTHGLLAEGAVEHERLGRELVEVGREHELLAHVRHLRSQVAADHRGNSSSSSKGGQGRAQSAAHASCLSATCAATVVATA